MSNTSNEVMIPVFMTKIKPFLKWAGNKFRCLDKILPSLPSGNRLIEPFTGSGAIFINTHYDSFLLAEQNRDLINLFKLIQQEGHSFIEFCAQYFSSDSNSSAHYYQIRARFNQSIDPRERAACFLYLNKHGYNGLCRFNHSGGYNVPFGRYKKPYFPQTEMIFFHKKCQSAEFIHADFRETFTMAKPGDVIYCDPPYVSLSSAPGFSGYTDKGFSNADQIELVRLAMESANRGIVVAISNHDTPFTRHHYQHGEILSFPVMRSISCKADQRSNAQELLAIFR